jgi:hypothetical protein
MGNENKIAQAASRSASIDTTLSIQPKSVFIKPKIMDLQQTAMAVSASEAPGQKQILVAKQKLASAGAAVISSPKTSAVDTHSVPLQLIATSNGMLALQSGPAGQYIILQQSSSNKSPSVGSLSVPLGTVTVPTPAQQQMQRQTKPLHVVVTKTAELSSSPRKRTVEQSTLQGGVKVCRTDADTNCQILSPFTATCLEANCESRQEPEIIEETTGDTESVSCVGVKPVDLPNTALLTAIREGYEKLFWKINMQAQVFRKAQQAVVVVQASDQTVEVCQFY